MKDQPTVRDTQPPPVTVTAGFARTVRCPRCFAQFDTPRRWEFVCLHCGHAWKETSVQTRRDKWDAWVESLLDRVTMPLLWLLVLAIVVAIFAPFFYWVLTRGRDVSWMVAAMVATAVAGVLGITVCRPYPRRLRDEFFRRRRRD